MRTDAPPDGGHSVTVDRPGLRCRPRDDATTRGERTAWRRLTASCVRFERPFRSSVCQSDKASPRPARSALNASFHSSVFARRHLKPR
jgi:hypothetical protein